MELFFPLPDFMLGRIWKNHYPFDFSIYCEVEMILFHSPGYINLSIAGVVFTPYFSQSLVRLGGYEHFPEAIFHRPDTQSILIEELTYTSEGIVVEGNHILSIL